MNSNGSLDRLHAMIMILTETNEFKWLDAQKNVLMYKCIDQLIRGR